MSTIIGVLGGMGPMATVNFFEKIVKNTSAEKDQEHHRMLIYNNPKIPSRVDAILWQGESPAYELIASIKLLEKAGASFIVIPCHTAHHWYQQLSDAVAIPIYSMIDVTTSHLLTIDKFENTEVLLLATTATVHAQLYQKSFAQFGRKIIIPTAEEQEIIMNAINQTKAGFIGNNPHLKELEIIIARHQKNEVLKDQTSGEKRINEKTTEEKEIEDKTIEEKQIKEKQIKEKQIKEKQIKEKIIKEKTIGEKTIEKKMVVVAGCTELSLLFPYLNCSCNLVDPMDILAKFILSIIDT